MKLTKIFLHLLTVLNLISAIGLGAMAVLSLFCCGRASSPVQGYLYANLAIGGVLAATLLQIVVIVLKIRNGQDFKRELSVAVFIVGLLVTVSVVVLSGNPLFGLLALVPAVVFLTRRW